MSQNKIKNVIFDLDGTLLPLDQDIFIKAYFDCLKKFLARHTSDAENIGNGIIKSTFAMMKNDGSRTNEELFWKIYEETTGRNKEKDEIILNKFYEKDFEEVKKVCGKNDEAKKAVDILHSMGFRIALATNPVFPAVATRKRIEWAGLSCSVFELVTSFENSSYAKPSRGYYEEVLCKLGMNAGESLMVGNDVTDDMSAEDYGFQVFLLTDCLLNRDEKDISRYPKGGFSELLEYIQR